MSLYTKNLRSVWLLASFCLLVFAPSTVSAHSATNTPATVGARQTQTGNRRNNRRRRKPERRQNVSQPMISVAFVVTPPETVIEMLRQADLQPGDVLYDLGSGDGRIPIAAAKDYGARAVGVELDPQLITESRATAKREGVDKLVAFSQTDLFRVNLRKADAVTLYLSNRINERLLPKLLRELRPGAKIISHDFKMGDWQPEKSIRVPWKNLYRTVHVWTVPARRKISRKRR